MDKLSHLCMTWYVVITQTSSAELASNRPNLLQATALHCCIVAAALSFNVVTHSMIILFSVIAVCRLTCGTVNDRGIPRRTTVLSVYYERDVHLGVLRYYDHTTLSSIHIISAQCCSDSIVHTKL